jgi:hypothetical protein
MKRQRRPPQRLEARERAHELHRNGLNYAEIGRELGINSGTVWRYINGQPSRGRDPKVHECPKCSGRMFLDRKRAWCCPDCGHRIGRWGRLTPEQKALARARTNKWRKKRQALFRRIIREAKDQPCADCGGKYPYYVMQFDHVRGVKKFGIATALSRVGTASPSQLRDEIAKCDVVCANCHALRHRGVYRDAA